LAALSDREIALEISALKAHVGEPNYPWWVGENLVLMTNGEYLIYAFRHGNNMGWPPHLFLARGSDGRWFYSSFHFCNGLIAACAPPPPGSIDEFAKRYGAYEFDGKSDECLKTTPYPKEKE
jgi:hypothetical protein